MSTLERLAKLAEKKKNEPWSGYAANKFKEAVSDSGDELVAIAQAAHDLLYPGTQPMCFKVQYENEQRSREALKAALEDLAEGA